MKWIKCGAFLLFLTFAATRTVCGGEGIDDVQTKLAAARSEFALAMDQARADLLQQLRDQQAFAQTQGDLNLLERTSAEAEAFASQDALPSLTSAARFEREEARQRRKLLQAIDATIVAYVKAGLIRETKALRDERTHLQFLLDRPQLRPFLDCQLIQNPGNELPLQLGQIPCWTSASGHWTQRSEDPLPAQGSAYFTADRGARGELTQTIDVSPLQPQIDASQVRYAFSAKLRSYPQRIPDTAEIAIDFLDQRMRKAAPTVSTGITHETGGWREFAVLEKLPPGTRQLRIQLISVRNSGANNDGYFDDLCLRLSLVCPEER